MSESRIEAKEAVLASDKYFEKEEADPDVDSEEAALEAGRGKASTNNMFLGLWIDQYS